VRGHGVLTMNLRNALRGLAVLLVVSGVAMLAVGVLQPTLQDARTDAAQDRLASSVPSVRRITRDAPVDTPAAPGKAPVHHRAVSGKLAVARSVAPGDALAVIRIPRFGASWSWVAVEGTSADDLDNGPGHYTGTPLPGQAGNVAFAAHRAGHGDPFIDFDRLRPGDQVIFSQRGATWIYRIDIEPRIIPVTAMWVLKSLPGHQLTLTTCWPKYGSAKRMYVHAHLVRTIVDPSRA
jgi:sortase A